MALFLLPLPPPQAPLSYSPPSDSNLNDLCRHLQDPLTMALSNVAAYLQELEEIPNTSLKYHLLTIISDTLNSEESRPVWPVLYPSSLLTNSVTDEVHSIQVDLNGLLNKFAHSSPPPHPPPADTASLAVLDKKIDDLKSETSTSLKSFAEAVKSTAAPSMAPPLPPRPKTNHLP